MPAGYVGGAGAGGAAGGIGSIGTTQTGCWNCEYFRSSHAGGPILVVISALNGRLRDITRYVTGVADMHRWRSSSKSRLPERQYK